MARVETGNYAKYIAPGLRKVYFDTLMGRPKEFRQWANVIPPKPSDRSGLHYFDDLELSSLGALALKAEGSPIQYQVPVEGNLVRYLPYVFGGGFRITEEMKEDDLYGPMTRMAQQLGLAAIDAIEVQAHRLLNGGFGTVSGTGLTAPGFDTLALFSAVHTTLNGGGLTRANKMSVDEDLSVTAVEHLMDLAESWINNSGMPAPFSSSVLIVGPTNKWIAKEITESELKPYTGNNEVNPLGGEGLSYFVDHYLTDPDSWFLLAPKSMHDMNVWLRREPKFETGDDFDTGDSKAKCTLRIASGHGSPDGVVASQGA